VAGEVGLAQGVPEDSAIVFAVREEFQQGWNRVVFGILRQPDPGGEPGAVGNGDEDVFDLPDRVGEGGFDSYDTAPGNLLLFFVV